MAKWKPWQKHLAQVLVFALLAGVLLAYTDRVLWNKSGTILGFYEEPKNSMDVLYLGGSHSNAAISPTQIYQEHGYTGYVLYSWSQPIWTSYHYLKEGLKRQKPKVVVLDSFGLVYGHTYISDVDVNNVSNEWSLLIPPSLNRMQLAMAMSRCQTDHRPFYRYASLLEYHNRWKVVTKEDLLWPFQSYATTGKGYGPIYTQEAFPQVIPPEHPVPGGMEPQCLEYLQKFIDLSKKEGFQLVLLTLPYVAQPQEFEIYQQAYELCRENGVAVLDYFDPATAAQAGFDWETDLAEHAHVNHRGAAKLTKHLGRWLAEQFQLPDHRGDPAYAQWEKDAAIETRNAQDMDLRLTGEPGPLLQKVMAPEYRAVVMTQGDLLAADVQSLRQAYQQVGLDSSVLDAADQCGLAVLENGKVQEQQTGPVGEMLQTQQAGEGWQLNAHTDGEQASVLLNGQEVWKGRPGVTVVVLDASSGELVLSVTFDVREDYAHFTD